MTLLFGFNMLNSRISALEMMFFLALDWIVKLDLIAFEEFPQDDTINVIIMIFNKLILKHTITAF